MFREDELEFPLTLGRDFAGIIVDKGYDVDASYKIGDSVYGIVPILRQGSHAQKVVVNESNVSSSNRIHSSIIEMKQCQFVLDMSQAKTFVTC